MRIEITMWGQNGTWKGLVLDGMYGVRGVIGSNKAIARYKDREIDVEIGITSATFLPTDQPSGKAYKPDDNEYEPNDLCAWQRVK